MPVPGALVGLGHGGGSRESCLMLWGCLVQGHLGSWGAFSVRALSRVKTRLGILKMGVTLPVAGWSCCRAENWWGSPPGTS